MDDLCILNKVVYLRLFGNVYFMNELIEVWESKIGKKLEKFYVLEEEFFIRIKGICFDFLFNLILFFRFC